jgi:hypothetical protein
MQIADLGLQPKENIAVLICNLCEPFCKPALCIVAQRFPQLLNLFFMLPRLLCQGRGVSARALFEMEVVFALLGCETVSSLFLAPHRTSRDLTLVTSLGCLSLRQ